MKMGNEKNKLAFIIPNLATAISLFLGILSVFASVRGDFEKAAVFIFLSMVFDGLDGRLARLTGTCSRFGVEFDSLADLVAFGVAPAMMLYYAVGIEMGKIGIIAAALFVVFGAIRLARFNVQSENTDDPNMFIGLPIPSAAVLVTCWTLLLQEYDIFFTYKHFLILLSFITALLMVSNIRYYSFKKMNLSKPLIMKIFVLVLLLLALMYVYFIETLACLISLYALSGILRAVYNLTIFKLKNRHQPRKEG